jgi:hypothetical protein
LLEEAGNFPKAIKILLLGDEVWVAEKKKQLSAEVK